MKIGAIGRSLVRFFRGPATTYAGKKQPASAADMRPDDVKRLLRSIGLEIPDDAHVEVRRLEVGAGDGAPPAAPEVGARAPTWDEWSAALREMHIPGWSVCRFAIRQSHEVAGQVTFVYGVVNGAFGIWRSEFPTVCRIKEGVKLAEWEEPDDDQIEQMAPLKLTCVSHLPSGLGVGLFFDRRVAADACELALRLDIDWLNLDPADQKQWAREVALITTAWQAAGIRRAMAHAHQDNGEIIEHIFERTAESIAEGKPERLS